MTDDQLFYVGQKALIEKDGRILVLNDPFVGADLPGGKVQIGEFDFKKSLEREVMEETGLTVSVQEPLSTGYFKFRPQIREQKQSDFVFIVAYKARYVSGELVLSDEHNSYQWVSKDDYQTIDDKSGFIKKILSAYFANQKASY